MNLYPLYGSNPSSNSIYLQMNPSAVLFHEKQKFNQSWLWGLLLLVFAPFAWGIVKQIILGEPWGDNTMSDMGLIAVTLLPLALIGFFYFVEMETRVTDEAIHIDFSPIAKVTFHWKDIENVEATTYGFVGYGFRLSKKYGKIYNVKGNQGLQLYLQNGRKVMIGTQRLDELAEVARQCMENR